MAPVAVAAVTEAVEDAGLSPSSMSRDELRRIAVLLGLVLLATGARSRELPNLPIDGEKIIGYRQAMTLPRQPKRMLVVGSGAIGVEFAYFYQTLGTQVTLVEFLPRVVPVEDEEISKALEKSLKKGGMTLDQTIEVPILGMDCAECTQHVQHAIAALPGVESVNVFLASEKAAIRLDPTLVDLPAIRKAVEGAGYSMPDTAAPPGASSRLDDFTRPILTLFGVVFALNSAVHSYLILAYADDKKVAMSLGGIGR